MRVRKKLRFGFVFHTGDGVKAAIKNQYEDTFAGFDSSELAELSEDLEANLAQMLAGSDTPELPDASDDPEDALASLADFVYHDESPETLSRQQQAVVNAAIKKAKLEHGFERRGDALFHICELFLEEHGA